MFKNDYNGRNGNGYQPLQDNLRNTKMQQAIQYATNIIEANKECFIAQWVMQNQDKNIDDYVLCYSYRGEAIKFWLERKE